MIRLLSIYWVVFNVLWLAGFFVILSFKGSVVVSEPRPWLAAFECVLCLVSLPALMYIAKARSG